MRVLIVAIIAFALGACAGQQSGPVEDLRKAVKAGAEFAVIAEPILLAQYQKEQQECLQSPPTATACVMGVRATWAPRWTAYNVARYAWCAVDMVIGQAKCQP